MRIKIINPNRTAVFTERCLNAGRAVAAPGSEILATNPAAGPASVECHLDEVLATLGVVEEVAAGEAAGVDAHVIACFGDTGLHAAREVANGPVVGMSEAAVYAAALIAYRFSIITLPSRTRIFSDRVLQHAGLEHRCAVRCIDVAVSDCSDESMELYEALLVEGRRALAEDHADAIVLGCAGLEMLSEPLRQALGVPVVEGVAAGVKMAEGLVSMGLATGRTGAWARPSAESLRDAGVRTKSKEQAV
jgi:allantoin racemase